MQVVSYPGNMTPEGRSDGGTARVNQCVIAGPVSLLEGGTWSGGENVFDSATLRSSSEPRSRFLSLVFSRSCIIRSAARDHQNNACRRPFIAAGLRTFLHLMWDRLPAARSGSLKGHVDRMIIMAVSHATGHWFSPRSASSSSSQPRRFLAAFG
jgi:hypothetical protein